MKVSFLWPYSQEVNWSASRFCRWKPCDSRRAVKKESNNSNCISVLSLPCSALVLTSLLWLIIHLNAVFFSELGSCKNDDTVSPKRMTRIMNSQCWGQFQPTWLSALYMNWLCFIYYWLTINSIFWILPTSSAWLAWSSRTVSGNKFIDIFLGVMLCKQLNSEMLLDEQMYCFSLHTEL